MEKVVVHSWKVIFPSLHNPCISKLRNSHQYCQHEDWKTVFLSYPPPPPPSSSTLTGGVKGCVWVSSFGGNTCVERHLQHILVYITTPSILLTNHIAVWWSGEEMDAETTPSGRRFMKWVKIGASTKTSSSLFPTIHGQCNHSISPVGNALWLLC